MSAHQADLPVRSMCEFFEVSRSGYYSWRSGKVSDRAIRDAKVTEAILEIHRDSHGSYGAPRIHVELAEEKDIHVGRKRVARLMNKAGIEGISRRKKPRTTQRDETREPAPDLVDRDFSAEGPDALWLSDITYIPTLSGFLYLAVVLDVWSRKIVGWSMATHMRSELVISALDMAIGQRDARGVIHHSDQGTQYTSIAFGDRCIEEGIVPSMGSVGDCYDNAMCESFFATLECELLDRTRFVDPRQAKAEVFEWIEGWYNPRRRHSALNYLSPNEFEERASLEVAA
jgi:putative transposase